MADAVPFELPAGFRPMRIGHQPEMIGTELGIRFALPQVAGHELTRNPPEAGKLADSHTLRFGERGEVHSNVISRLLISGKAFAHPLPQIGRCECGHHFPHRDLALEHGSNPVRLPLALTSHGDQPGGRPFQRGKMSQRRLPVDLHEIDTRAAR